jgi:hypothetical protein
MARETVKARKTPTRELVWACRRCRRRRRKLTAEDQLRYRCDGPCDICGRGEMDLFPLRMTGPGLARARRLATDD